MPRESIVAKRNEQIEQALFQAYLAGRADERPNKTINGSELTKMFEQFLNWRRNIKARF